MPKHWSTGIQPTKSSKRIMGRNPKKPRKGVPEPPYTLVRKEIHGQWVWVKVYGPAGGARP